MDDIRAQLSAVQRELERAQARCSKVEERLRARQRQLAPLRAAAQQLQATAEAQDRPQEDTEAGVDGDAPALHQQQDEEDVGEAQEEVDTAMKDEIVE